MHTFAVDKTNIMKNILLLLTLLFFSGQINTNCQNILHDSLTRVMIETDSGSIIIELFNDTPLHRDNFIKLTEEGYFDGQIFHRLIKNFMIQGGDPASRNASKGELLGQGGPGYTIPAEFRADHFHQKGALAAARKGDDLNPLKASSGSQFYIVEGNVFTRPQLDYMVQKGMHDTFTNEQIAAYTTLGGSPHLDGSYTVFGQVVSGFDVLEKLMNSPVDEYDRPINDIKYSIKVIK